jgi:DUF438 domain-containing protein
MSELIDNRAHRVRTLTQIIKSLHAGEPAETAKESLKALVSATDYAEIVSMEQELMAGGMPVEEVMCMCDLHSQITRESLVQLPAKPVAPGHPADTFRRENEALRGVIARMRQAAAEGSSMAWREAYNDLMDIEKHYQRKEHVFFSCLERHGISGPSKVMWAKDDEVRGLLKQLGEAPGESGEKAIRAVEEMMYKEDNILLPMCLDNFTEDEWAEAWLASPRYGWCLVTPREGYQPPASVVQKGLKLPAGEGIQLPTGNLTLEQLLGMFSMLPVDLTFVGADDRVAFFSEGPDRIFARSQTIIGRKVQHCHPPRSVDVVERILADFRSGRQDVAEFWINLHGRFVHIRYFAVRNADKQYIGTLEVTQDITRLKALEGERRLLEYT